MKRIFSGAEGFSRSTQTRRSNDRANQFAMGMATAALQNPRFSEQASRLGVSFDAIVEQYRRTYLSWPRGDEIIGRERDKHGRNCYRVMPPQLRHDKKGAARHGQLVREELARGQQRI